MAAILTAIGRGFGGLLRFSGRDRPGQFWAYAIFLFLFSQAAMFAILLPQILGTFERMQRFAIEHPSQVTVTSGPGHYSIQIHGHHPELMPDFTALALAMAAGTAIVVALLAAAVARRLHDRDRSGLWGLLPLPFLAAGLVLMPVMFAAFQRGGVDPRIFFALFANNLAYLATLAFLIFLLAGAGTKGPNRFGPEPAAP